MSDHAEHPDHARAGLMTTRRSSDRVLLRVLLGLLVFFTIVSVVIGVVAIKTSHDLRVQDAKNRLKGCQGGALIIATYLYDKAADAEKIAQLSTSPGIRRYFADQAPDLRKRGAAYANPKACDHPENLPAISPNQPTRAP